MVRFLILVLGSLSISSIQAGDLADGDTGNWEFYQRNNGSEHYALLDANSSDQFYFGSPRLVLYCIASQKNFGAFIRWNQFIDSTIHPIRLKIDQQPTLLMSWLAGADGENSWLPAGQITSKVDCGAEACARPRRVTFTHLDLIAKMVQSKAINVATTDTKGNEWSAEFFPYGMRVAASNTLGFCGINAQAL